MNRDHCNTLWLAHDFVLEALHNHPLRVPLQSLSGGHAKVAYLTQTQLTRNGKRFYIEVTLRTYYELLPAYVLCRPYTVSAGASSCAPSELTWILISAAAEIEVCSGMSARKCHLSTMWICHYYTHSPSWQDDKKLHRSILRSSHREAESSHWLMPDYGRSTFHKKYGTLVALLEATNRYAYDSDRDTGCIIVVVWGSEAATVSILEADALISHLNMTLFQYLTRPSAKMSNGLTERLTFKDGCWESVLQNFYQRRSLNQKEYGLLEYPSNEREGVE